MLRPIPDFTAVRSETGYRDYPLLPIGVHKDEPLVDIADYAIAGQSYYSRRNGATGKPVAGVNPTVLMRKSIAERLSAINYELQRSKEVQELLGGKVELFINEGYRSVELQQKLYDEVFPELIRSEHPKFTTAQVNKMRDERIARPPEPGQSPSPHATGAAVDLRLRYQQPELSYVAGTAVDMGKGKRTSLLTYPDYFEHHKPINKKDKTAQQNRRVFYWVMRGALLGDDSGFVANPVEWWHWSYGDQLWAQLTKAPAAFFSFAPGT